MSHSRELSRIKAWLRGISLEEGEELDEEEARKAVHFAYVNVNHQGGVSGEGGGATITRGLEEHNFVEKVLVPLLPSVMGSTLGAGKKRKRGEDERKEFLVVCMAMVVEKDRQGLPQWDALASGERLSREEFDLFLRSCGALISRPQGLEAAETRVWLAFFTVTFRSLENPWVRNTVLKLVSLQLWCFLADNKREEEFAAIPKLRKYWNKVMKKEKKEEEALGSSYVPLLNKLEAKFFPSLYGVCMGKIDELGAGATNGTSEREVAIENSELFLQLVTELLSQLPTRRFVKTYLINQGFLVRCRRTLGDFSPHRHHDLSLLSRLIEWIEELMHFEVNDQDGTPISDEDMLELHYERVQKLQRMVFKIFTKLKKFPLVNCSKACEEEFIKHEIVSRLCDEELRAFVTEESRILDPRSPLAKEREALVDVLVQALRKPKPRMKFLEMLPLYPTEAVLFDTAGSIVPDSQGKNNSSSSYKPSDVTGLPRLNLQFLTFRDYLVRNFRLLQLEAAYEIREDIKEVIPRMGAYLNDDDELAFSGWARMASPVRSFRVVDVGQPNLGEEKPSHVRAEIEIDLSGYKRRDIKNEWDAIKKHDVLFLIAVDPYPEEEPRGAGKGGEGNQEDFRAASNGVKHVRGCEVIGIRDEKGESLCHFGFHEVYHPPSGSKRTLIVSLDSIQYHQDVVAKRDKSVYNSFGLLVRRGARESNFKAVLECIRDLAKEDTMLPNWLHDVFLGYGDPASSHCTSMPEDQIMEIDFRDTFLDADHLVRSFPGWKIRFTGGKESLRNSRCCFRVKFREALSRSGQEGRASQIMKISAGSMLVEPYDRRNATTENAVEFTAVQATAILSGLQRGLTMIVGPPGTGKTDVAVQILELLYHNYSGERILLLTHSNQALNDLFMKIMKRDVPARYLLRLGMGEQELETDMEFSRLGRVNAMLERRLRLLSEVARLSSSMGVTGDYASTCENCSHFWLLHVLSKWEQYEDRCKKDKSPSAITEGFPFKPYFEGESKSLFPAESSAEENMAIARSCFMKLKELFAGIEECRPFELLHSQTDRLNYLMTKQAKIVAMTCTYAAMKRSDFVKLALEFDSVVMEESAQVLDIETIIPLRLQRDVDGMSRLKRCILVGDHNQLPPVVKNKSLSRSSNLEQSLFTRLIRLGAPYIELNAQGRSRPSIAELYNWRYESLGDLKVVGEGEYLFANPGFAFDYQFINVNDYNGQGEYIPAPHYVQNLGEAEYAVTLYQHMRLLGYPADKITILTTYNGQKALIKDVVQRRCSHYLFGSPAKVETVDRFQGQQNDYVILSLVRTRSVGHIRDVRRLVVAMSRARLGLFVLGRESLFSGCLELKPTFKKLLERPTELQIVPGEGYASKPKVSDERKPVPISMENLTRQVVEDVQKREKQNYKG